MQKNRILLTLLAFIAMLGINVQSFCASETPQKGKIVKVANPFPLTDINSRYIISTQLPFDPETMENSSEFPGYYYVIKPGHEEKFRTRFTLNQSLIGSAHKIHAQDVSEDSSAKTIDSVPMVVSFVKKDEVKK